MATSFTIPELLRTLVDQQALSAEVASTVINRAAAAEQAVEVFLLNQHLVSDEQLAMAKAKLFDVAYVDLKDREIAPAILKLLPQTAAENYQMVAFARDATTLSIGFVDPKNFKAVEAADFLVQKAQLKLIPHIISAASFAEALKRYQALGEEVEEALSRINQEVFRDGTDIPTLDRMEAIVRSAPVSKMVLVIIRHAIDGRASDIHIEPSLTDTKVRYRIDGLLKTSLVLPKYIHAAVVARIKVLANLRLDESRKPQDGRIRLTVDGKEVDLRVSTLPLFEGEKVALRILEASPVVPTLAALGFSPWHIALAEEALRKPHGLVLLTGPTGSGKTTTLYTILSMLNQDGVNIVTLEDPIEYYMTGVNQSQINPEVGYSFATGLRAILRQDPNIVMLGEIRDNETTQLVVHASLTGHLVLSTLHTNSALGAIPRLLDLGAEPFLLSSVLNIVIAQRLARKICPDCKQPEVVPDVLQQTMLAQLQAIPERYRHGIDVSKLTVWRGKGCAHCGLTGYRDRIAVAEVIAVTPALADIINQGGHRQMIEDELAKQNFITLTQDCLLKAVRGETTLEEVLRVSQL